MYQQKIMLIDLEIREMLKVDDKDMTIILEAYPYTKILL